MITPEMRRDARRIYAKDAAVIVRKILKTHFPKCNFYVRTKHHTSVKVYWMDGPSVQEVEAVADVGSVFGVDMTDYAYSGYHWLNPDNTITPAYCEEINLDNPKPHKNSELVMFYSNYADFDRVLSEERCKELAEEAQINQHPYTLKAYDWYRGGTKASGEQYYTLERDWSAWESEHQIREFWKLKKERSFYPRKGKKTPTPKDQNAPNPKLAERMRKTAENMTSQIEAKLNPAIADQNPTPRRASIAAAMYDEGQRLAKIQAVLFTLADMQEAGNVPPEFADMTSKKAVDDAFYSMKDQLKPLIEGKVNAPDPKERELKEKITEALFMKLPGYFPTPDTIIDRMLKNVYIGPETKALEPSAGSGNIADRLRELGAQVDICETSYILREILELKGYTLNGYDFLEHKKGGYDAIVMNPPFENNQDIYHVMKAYNCLDDGGTLVSIMSAGPFFREDKKARGFRHWLDHVGGWSEELPEGSFKESGTGVNTRMVVITKQ